MCLAAVTIFVEPIPQARHFTSCIVTISNLKQIEQVYFLFYFRK